MEAARKLLGQVYELGLQIDRAVTRERTLPRPVLSIGNIAVGGRAKTPLVIRVARELKKRGATPVVLTRGYGRKNSRPLWLDPSTSGFSISAKDSGDEPLEIFLKADCHVLVGSDRFNNAQLFLKRFPKTPNVVFVLDDGFQHWKLKRDFDICIVQSFDMEGELLPTGWLREGPKAVARADCVLELGKSLKKNSFFKAPPKKLEHALAITTRVVGSSYRDFLKKHVPDCESVELKDHADDRAILDVLKEKKPRELILGFKEAVKLFFFDDLRKLLKEGVLDTTLDEEPLRVYVVDVEIELSHEEEFWIDLFEKLY